MPVTSSLLVLWGYEVSSSELSSPVDPFDLSSTTAIASKYQLDVDPENPLEVAGQWRLIIEDVEQGNSGELLDWTLHFYGKENEKTSYPGGLIAILSRLPV